jgi:hypothetical protein
VFEWLKVVNRKKLKDDPGLQANQPKDSLVDITNDVSLDASLSVDPENMSISSASLTVIRRF